MALLSFAHGLDYHAHLGWVILIDNPFGIAVQHRFKKVSVTFNSDQSPDADLSTCYITDIHSEIKVKVLAHALPQWQGITLNSKISDDIFNECLTSLVAPKEASARLYIDDINSTSFPIQETASASSAHLQVKTLPSGSSTSAVDEVQGVRATSTLPAEPWDGSNTVASSAHSVAVDVGKERADAMISDEGVIPPFPPDLQA